MGVPFKVNGPYRFRGSSRRLREVAVLALLVLLLAVPLAFSSHQFADVPTSHVFHAAISNLVNAGVTSGCATGLYCPDNAVTRAQMAAFLGRTSSNVGFSSVLIDSSIAAADGFVTVADKTITVPGTTGGTQFVQVYGEVTVFGSPAGCPCNINLLVRDATSGALSSTKFYRFNTVYDQHVMQAAWVFSVPSGTTRTYQLQVAVFQGAFSLISPALIVTTHPFGATGEVSLGPGVSPAAPDAAPDGRPLR